MTIITLAIVVVVAWLYVRYFYVQDLTELCGWLRGRGWGLVATVAVVAVALVGLVLFYELPLP
jgi:hypothetical protein